MNVKQSDFLKNIYKKIARVICQNGNVYLPWWRRAVLFMIFFSESDKIHHYLCIMYPEFTRSSHQTYLIIYLKKERKIEKRKNKENPHKWRVYYIMLFFLTDMPSFRLRHNSYKINDIPFLSCCFLTVFL